MKSDARIPSYEIESLKASAEESRDFDFFRFEYFAADIEHLKAPHRHNFYTFLLVTEGSGSHSIDFQSFKLTSGRLFMIGPGQVHAWENLEGVAGFVVLFNDSFMPSVSDHRELRPWSVFNSAQPAVFDLPGVELGIWISAFEQLEAESLMSDPHSKRALFHLINLLMVRVLRLFQGSKTGDESIEPDKLVRFKRLIEENFTTIQKPRDYATMLNVTANYLNALCRQRLNISAGELIRQRIILEAKRQLAYTNLTVSEIAFRLNFQDNSYFGRFFRKYADETPGNFRARQGKSASV